MPRGDRSVLVGIVLVVCAAVGYAVTTGIGLIWAEHPTVAIVASITVSLLVWIVTCLWFVDRTQWYRSVAIVLVSSALLFPMVGTASLGTDLALEHDGEHVTGEVVDIDVEQTNSREDEKSWKTTYTFEDADGRSLGTIDYRGGKEAYGLETGDTAELLVDPTGEVPPKRAEDVDSSDDIGMALFGAVLYLLVWALGMFWPMVRGRLRRDSV